MIEDHKNLISFFKENIGYLSTEFKGFNPTLFTAYIGKIIPKCSQEIINYCFGIF